MIRWFSRHSPFEKDEHPLPNSTGARVAHESSQLWWRDVRADRDLPLAWAAVQAIVSRFVYSPYQVPSMLVADARPIRDLPCQRVRVVNSGGEECLVTDDVFRACALPVAMLL